MSMNITDNEDLNSLWEEINNLKSLLEEKKDEDELLTELFARPDWENYLDNSLEIGCDYVYPVSDETAIRGRVLFNDGVTAILQVTNRYEECFFEILYYDEVKRFFPQFTDPDAKKLKEYLCLDVETESNLFFRDPDTDIIGHLHFDENGKFVFSPLDENEFRIERFKKLITYRLAEMGKEEEEKQKSYESTISVDLSALAIDEMYQEYDQQHGNPNPDDVFYRSLKRSIHWLTHRNCAIVTAWRGKYNRKANDARNNELQQKLRALGYGVIKVKGCYAEIGRPLEKENSFLVFDLDDSKNFMQNIYDLSEYYEQDCFLYKPVDEEVAYLVGTNDDYGKDRIDLAGYLTINSETADAFTKVASGIISFEKNSA